MFPHALSVLQVAAQAEMSSGRITAHMQSSTSIGRSSKLILEAILLSHPGSLRSVSQQDKLGCEKGAVGGDIFDR